MLEATMTKCRKELLNKLKEYEALEQEGLLTKKQSNRRNSILNYFEILN